MSNPFIIGLFVGLAVQTIWLVYLSGSLQETERELNDLKRWSYDKMREVRAIDEEARDAHRVVFYAGGILDRLGLAYRGYEVRETKSVNLERKKKQ